MRGLRPKTVGALPPTAPHCPRWGIMPQTLICTNCVCAEGIYMDMKKVDF